MRLCKPFCTIVLIAQFLPLVFAAIPPKEAKAFSGIVISEVAWAGSSLSQADEWIELFNPTDADVSIEGWYLSGAGSSEKNIIFPHGALIKAQDTYLIANYEFGNEKTNLTITPDIATSTLSISNSSLLIKLIDNNDTVIDTAGSGGNPPAGLSSEIKISMQRDDVSVGGDLDSAWVDAKQSTNINTNDLGTPGQHLQQKSSQDEQNQDAVEQNAEIEPSATSTEVILNNPETNTTSTTTEVFYTTTTDNLAETQDADVKNNDNSTTTNLILEFEQATGTTGTVSTTNQVIEAPETNEATTSTENQVVTTSNDLSLTKKYKYLRINEVMAAPAEGKEWVELFNSSVDWAVELDGVELHDSVGKIMILDGSIEPQGYKIITINSSRLNNNGDSVKLYAPDTGELLDTVTYLSMQKGIPYARDEKANWRETLEPTPGYKNIIKEAKVEKVDDEVKNIKNSEKVEADHKDSLQPNIKESELNLNIEKATQNNTTTTKTCIPFLNEFMPNPEQGPEWIELTCMSTTTLPAIIYTIHDASGKIASFASDELDGEYPVIELSSARLNNSGDIVSIVNDSGDMVDQFEYQESKKGYSWAKQDDDTWVMLDTVTAGEKNKELAADDIAPADDHAVEESTIKTSEINTKDTISDKSNIYLITHDMINDANYGGLRVALEGMVGSPLKHTPGRSFVLLNQEGKGLLVKVPSRLKQPEMGKWLKITGTLKFDTNDSPYLSLGTKDGWIEQEINQNIKVREVYLPAPAAEDAWSYVNATATVQGVSGKTIQLISQDADIVMKIKPSVSYRASRLTKGDEIAISGILDLSGEVPAILPRQSDEILLLTHAETWSNNEQKKEEGLPGWTPFGAAAVAIGTLEGVKAAKKTITNSKRKKLQKNRQPA